MNANQTMKNERIALIRDRVEARAEYAQDFELVPVACLEPGTYVLSMIEETLASLDEQAEIKLEGFAAQLERISNEFDLRDGFNSMDVVDFVDASFEIMGVSR
jgi:phage protein U